MNVIVEYSSVFKNITKTVSEIYSFTGSIKAIELLYRIIEKHGPLMRSSICIDRNRKLFAVILIYNKTTSINLDQFLFDGDIITLMPYIVGG